MVQYKGKGNGKYIVYNSISFFIYQGNYKWEIRLSLSCHCEDIFFVDYKFRI